MHGNYQALIVNWVHSGWTKISQWTCRRHSYEARQNDYAAREGSAMLRVPHHPIQGQGNQSLAIQRLTSFLPTLKQLKWLIHDISQNGLSHYLSRYEIICTGKLCIRCIRGHNAYC